MRLATRIIASLLALCCLSTGLALSQNKESASWKEDGKLVDAVGYIGDGQIGKAGKLLE